MTGYPQKPILPSAPDILVVVQARAGSTRLPGKILLPVAGKPMLVFLMERLRAGLPWPVLVATSDGPSDDATERAAISAGFPVSRGDEEDVFSRFRKAAEITRARHLVRLTGDNPLIDTGLVRRCVASHLESEADFTSTREIAPDGTVVRHVPKGQSVDVIKTEALLRVPGASLSDDDREHVIPAFFRPEFKFVLNVLKDAETREPALSVDTREDYERLLEITGA